MPELATGSPNLLSTFKDGHRSQPAHGFVMDRNCEHDEIERDPMMFPKMFRSKVEIREMSNYVLGRSSSTENWKLK